MNLAIALSVIGAASVFVGWFDYFAKVYRNAAPRRPTGTMILEVGGSLSALAGLILSFADGGSPGVAVIGPAAFALTMGPFFPAILTQRKTPLGDLKVAVGTTMPPFSALTSAGQPFHSDELMGRRILFKFFRGAW